ncbi:magnesium/cobalt transporter CorA [Methyloversatilis thermotolerans]|uniref:magnesium/cobalt transporter CorA n=1 Tax=Methyloversatilis thermotolerans TaxID=1346290 RepID=UPI000368E0A3|nr:magnesium/cobalt transporter CorA [Methyloversatilis thermotolerans]
MLHCYALVDGRLSHIADDAVDASLDRIVWIDAVSPDAKETVWLLEQAGIGVDAPDDDADIEASARAFIDENGALHLRTDMLIGRASSYTTEALRFVIGRQRLVSLHDEDLPIMRLLRLRSRARPGRVTQPTDIVVELFALDVEQSADALEDIYAELESVSARVLGEQRGSDEDAAESITRLARNEDLNGTIRRNLMDTRRALSWLMREHRLSKAQTDQVKQILRDIESLNGHTAFIFDKINFLMDAIIGFINLNQNKVVKIFSVASVAMLPPTLIASIYGMNFEYMPELRQSWGYPFSLVLMALSVALPFWYFRRKGWLK